MLKARVSALQPCPRMSLQSIAPLCQLIDDELIAAQITGPPDAARHIVVIDKVSLMVSRTTGCSVKRA